MTNHNFKISHLVAAMIIASTPALAAAATIDIGITDVTYTDANIVITPSEDAGKFYYGLMSAEEFNSNNGVDGIVNKCISEWETMGSWYSKTWIEMLPSVLFEGEQAFRANDFTIKWDTEYVVYAFGMNEQTGDVTIPVVTKNFTTLAAEHSDNTFTITVDKVAPTEGSSFYMDVTVTVTPTNDDPYAVLVQQTRYLDYYDGSDETKSMESYFADQFAPYVRETYTGKQTITFGRQQKDKDMYVVVAGFNGAPTTDLFKASFRTEEPPAATIGIDITDVTYTDANIVITPSENVGKFYYGLMSAEEFNSNNGVDGIVNKCISEWETMGSWYSKTWIEMLPSVLYEGEQAFRANEFSIKWDTEYVVYAFGMNEQTGEVTIPVVTKNFTTLAAEHSDNTFTITVDKVAPTEGSSFYMDVTVTVTPTNDDPYAVLVQQTRYLDYYDGSDETKSMESYFADQFAPYVRETYTGKQTITFGRQQKNKDMYVVVAGFNGAPTTDLFKVAFRTEEIPAVPTEDIAIDITDLTRREATVTYTPVSDDIHYFRSVMKKAKFFDENNGVEGIYEFDKSWFEFLASMTTDNTWEQIFYGACVTGKTTETASYLYGSETGLEWGTDYVAYAYGINEAGEVTTPVSYVEFSTPQRGNNTDLTFELSVLDITQNEDESTFTARINVVPSTSDTYATHYHDVYYYDWYVDNPNYTFEDYLFTQFDKFINETYVGENTFVCPDIKEGINYYFVVTGYDDSPNTDIFKIQFKGEEMTGVKDVTDSMISIRINNRTLTINGAFDFGSIYTIDGRTAATFRSDNPTVELPSGIYVVETVKNGVKNVEKVVVK